MLGLPEIVMILTLVLVLFGGKSLPGTQHTLRSQERFDMDRMEKALLWAFLAFLWVLILVTAFQSS